PEPVSVDDGRFGRVETLDQISMAFLVLLQRLTAAERAVLLLHDVFDFAHAEVAAMVGRTEAAWRQLLKRAHEHIAAEGRAFDSSAEEHRRLLSAFLQAASAGNADDLIDLLTEDAVLIADAGPERAQFGRART